MDMTESYRQPAPDIISKSDFFDFVTSNELTDAQYKQQMRSVNVFMESPDSHSNPLLSDEPKEQNNNSLLSVVGAVSSSETNMTTATTTLQSFDSIWNVDRERDRLETAMLEDLNKFYWNQDGDINNSSAMDTQTTNNKLISNNTDGQIYTLTVLNHEASEATGTNRYWGKEEEVSLSSPIEMEQIQQSSLDLESILNIMPSQMNGFPNDFNQDALTNTSLEKVDSFVDYDDNNHDGHASNVTVADQIIKVEDFSYDESEFNQVEVKEETMSNQMIIDTPLLEAQVEFNNNNNDWKLTNQNSESNESLLRSALQGKAFIRYSNAAQKIITNKIDSSGEIKKIIINNNNNKIDMPSMYHDTKEMSVEHVGTNQLVMTLAPSNGVNIVLFEDNCETVLPEAENPTTTQCVDDILLSQLDASYPEDFEKLKRIANEVAESVQQFCVEQVDPSRNIYNIHHLNGAELVTMIPTQGDAQISQTHLQIVTSPAVTSTKCGSKKSKSGSKNKTSTIQANQSHIISGSTTSSIQTATSTSNGIRKERSLHYCSICSKGFKDKYSVNVHVRTHTGEKPFSCSLCGKSFRQKAHLAKHYQTHIAQKNAAANGAIKTTKQR